MKEIKPITVKKSVKHTFSPDEIARLNIEFRQAYANAEAVEADAASIKSQLKAKIDEATGRMKTLNATLQAGFEYREKELLVIFRTEEKKKDYYLASDGKGELSLDERITAGEQPVLTEPMTAEDFEQDLIQAESAFENRVELILWEAGDDEGRMIVGSLKGKWFTAIRGNVGAHKIEERLDGEQMATKKRFDAITRAAKRVNSWLSAALGKDAAKGFEEPIFKVVEGEKEKAE